ncbi:acyl carrier protein [Streptomyces rubrogriseus]
MLLPTYPFARRHFWAAPAPAPAPSGPEGPTAGATRKAELPDLVAAVRTAVGDVLGEHDATGLDDDIVALGLDSLAAVELRGRLQALTDLPIGLTDILDNPTIRSLAEALARRGPSRRPR